MPSDGHSGKVRTVPLRRTIPGLLRDTVKAVEEFGRFSDGDIVRLNMGVFRPYLVTHPDHVQHILRDNAANYPREGMMWKPLTRLVGQIAGEGPEWALNRGIFQNLLAGPNIAALAGEMAETIHEAVDDLADRAGSGEPVDAVTEMTRIVQRAIIRVFFGNKISFAQIDDLAEAIRVATTSIGPRMLLPFVPHAIPLPGDRPFQRSVQIIDEVMLPLVRESRRQGATGNDIVSMLLRARDEQGRALDDKQIRDGVVAMFVAGTETTATALTWLWVMLDSHPAVADRMAEEIERVVGTDRPGREHAGELVYTKMVVQELMRIRSVGWIIPRLSKADDVVGGFKVKGGQIVLISPYLTHRLPEVWENPEVFDPERFAPDRRRHRFAYIAFGAGPHQCVGTVFFTLEAQLVVATMMTRLRTSLHSAPPIEPQVRLTLTPRERVKIAVSAHDR